MHRPRVHLLDLSQAYFSDPQGARHDEKGFEGDESGDAPENEGNG